VADFNLYHIQFVLKRTIKARLCSLFSHIKNPWKLLLGEIKKRSCRRFPVKPGAMDKCEPAGWQPAVCKWNKNQGLFRNVPFNAKERLKGNAATIPGQCRHQTK
jgi:hypothetical protein